MDKYTKAFERVHIIHKIFIIGYFSLAAILFLGGFVGLIISGIRNMDFLLSLSLILGFGGPVLMWILYIACIQWLWDKKIAGRKKELINSNLSADEIMEFGKRLRTDLFSVAIEKRCKELGLEGVPEWCVRDGILPQKEDIKDIGEQK